MIKKLKDLEIGDVFVDKQNKKLRIYVGCVLLPPRFGIFSSRARFCSYQVTDNYKTYVKKKFILHFLKKNHNYVVTICNLATSIYRVNVLYNIKEELERYELKKALCGYDVANCKNTKENIEITLDREKLELQYIGRDELAYKLYGGR